MRDTLRNIGVTETDFIRECDASFKQGSKFQQWVTGREDDYYFHPFVLPQGYTETNLVAGWLQRHAEVPFADLVSFQPHLCAHSKAPKQIATPEYAAVANYAYHLDAGKFGLFLRKHCIEKLGRAPCARSRRRHQLSRQRRHRVDADAGTWRNRRRSVRRLHRHAIAAARPALRRAVPFAETCAVQRHARWPCKCRTQDEDSPIASQTISTAQSNGWIWDIGLPTRRGVGHVYSSAHTSDEAAERELRNYVERTGGPKGHGGAAQADFQSRLSRRVLASQLRGDRTVRGLHRAAGGVGASRWSNCRPRC